jgi:outer membrane lipoprotein carrier protein
MNRFLPTFFILGMLACVLPIPRAGATDRSLEETIRKIETSHEAIRDFQAEFQQVTRFEGFETVVSSKGRLYFKKPGRLRWEYLEPNRNEVVVHQDKIWVFTPELKQVIIIPFSEFSDSQIPLHLLIEVAHLNRDFEIKWTNSRGGNEASDPIDRSKLTLRPKEREASLDKIEIEVDPERYLITRIDLFENNGNLSSFTFSRMKTNTGLNDKLFTFRVPNGIEVIESPLDQ